jgi:hypothetical protein
MHNSNYTFQTIRKQFFQIPLGVILRSESDDLLCNPGVVAPVILAGDNLFAIIHCVVDVDEPTAMLTPRDSSATQLLVVMLPVPAGTAGNGSLEGHELVTELREFGNLKQALQGKGIQ